MGREAGQATVEALAAIPVLLFAGALVLQLLLCGYALALADGAAEAGALALAAGRPARRAVEDSLPRWAATRTDVAVHGGKVTVRLRPPSLWDVAANRLTVTSQSFARPAR